MDYTRRETMRVAHRMTSLLILSVFFSLSYADTICDGRSDGLYRHPEICEGYIQCFRGTAHSHRCTSGLYFNEAIQSCDYQHNVQCDVKFEPDVLPKISTEIERSSEVLTSGPDFSPDLPVESNDVIHGITEESIKKLKASIVSPQNPKIDVPNFLTDSNNVDFPSEPKVPPFPSIPKEPAPPLPPQTPSGGDFHGDFRSLGNTINAGIPDTSQLHSQVLREILIVKKFAPEALVDAQNHLRQRLRDEAAVVLRMQGVIDNFSFRYVNAFFGAKPYAKYLSHSGNTLLETSRIIQNKFTIPSGDILRVMGQVPLDNYIKQLPETGRPDVPFPIPPDIDFCPFPRSYICDASSKYRTADGTCNNLRDPIIGRAMTPYTRLVPAVYGNGIDTVRVSVLDGPLPGPRHVSYRMFPDVDRRHFLHTLLLMSFGQFLDHDLTRTAITKVSKEEGGFGDTEEVKCGFDGCGSGKPGLESCLPIPIPENDPDFRGLPCLKFVRSQEVPSISCSFTTREQLNQVTSWVDASNVYGSTMEEQNDLRDFSNPDRGTLKVHPHPHGDRYKPLLPQDDVDLCRGTNRTVKCFKAGDERVNEQVSLTAVHTIWVRQHNYIEGQLKNINPHWTGEKLFQESRRIVSAMMQHIVYNEFLPVLLGEQLLNKHGLNLLNRGYYHGYDNRVNGGMTQAFVTAAFRLHTLVDERLGRTNENFQNDDSLFLSSAFRRPRTLYDTASGGIDSYLRGLCEHNCQQFDSFFTKQISRSLFAEQPPFGLGMDLLALNIQRARDHGVAGYNTYRELCGLGRARTFEDLAKDIPFEASLNALRKIYKHVDDIDLFAGGVSERHVPGGVVGPTFGCIIGKQFEALRKGDRFWYENRDAAFTPAQLDEIRKSRLSRVICVNSDTMNIIQPYSLLKPFREAFANVNLDNYDESKTGMQYQQFISLYKEDFNARVPCNTLPELDLSKWAER